MCLSTVYKNKLSPETIVMKNVMKVECREGMVILTDLMERQVAVEGQLQEANLVDGFVIVKESIPA
ncbi:MAG: CooT family nickel-binding protein [Candidatus Faecousia sp.]|nr:CooT family nickel-binding protein [Bacillota bacterium]MDY4219639.1 CooT family nickel-binding protein [Candidatus Faecousia sp.]